jgi:hypothetical protein
VALLVEGRRVTEKKENPLTHLMKDLMKDQAVENNTFMIAIMMLIARETERDPKFPEWMGSWLDRSLAQGFGVPATDDQLIKMREKFQRLLQSGEKIANAKNTAVKKLSKQTLRGRFLDWLQKGA